MPTQIIPTSTNVANRNSAQNKSVNCGAVEGCGLACARAQPGTRNIGGVARAKNIPFARRCKAPAAGNVPPGRRNVGRRPASKKSRAPNPAEVARADGGQAPEKARCPRDFSRTTLRKAVFEPAVRIGAWLVSWLLTNASPIRPGLPRTLPCAVSGRARPSLPPPGNFPRPIPRLLPASRISPANKHCGPF